MKRLGMAGGVVALTLLALCGCATVVGGSKNNVAVSSVTAGIRFEIIDEHGNVVEKGTTPATVVLKPGAGYFKGATYTIKYQTASGEKTADIGCQLNGWYVSGNFVFGALVGWLIVDPMTGAMWKLPKTVILPAAYGTSGELNIRSLDEVHPDMRQYLERLN